MEPYHNGKPVSLQQCHYSNVTTASVTTASVTTAGVTTASVTTASVTTAVSLQQMLANQHFQ